jgi:hypothetical protein
MNTPHFFVDANYLGLLEPNGITLRSPPDEGTTTLEQRTD